MNHWIYDSVNALSVTYILFGDEIRIIFGNNNTDHIFWDIFFISFILYIVDIVLHILTKVIRI